MIDEILKYSEKEILKSSDLQRLLIKEVEKHYNFKFNLGCRNCIADGFILLTRINKNKNLSKMNKKYILKEGIILYIGYENNDYTNHNLTDEKARELIKKNRKILSNFSEYPKEEVENLFAVPDEKSKENNLLKDIIKNYKKSKIIEELIKKNILYSNTDKKEALAALLIKNI